MAKDMQTQPTSPNSIPTSQPAGFFKASHILCHQFQPIFSPFSLKINQILLESAPNLNFPSAVIHQMTSMSRTQILPHDLRGFLEAISGADAARRGVLNCTRTLLDTFFGLFALQWDHLHSSCDTPLRQIGLLYRKDLH